MEKYVIEGNQRLSGTIVPSGNKNAVLPILCTVLLTEEPIELTNVPDIIDVKVMLDILDNIGVTITKKEKDKYVLRAGKKVETKISAKLAGKIRASVLLAGPLLSRHQHVELYPPGGDVIGRRRLDTHIHVFQELGAKVEIEKSIVIQGKRLIGKEIFLDEPSVTATENAIMAAVLAEGETVLYNAASEPHVQDLIDCLKKMGAKIEGRGSNVVKIIGVNHLHGCKHKIINDHIELGSFIGLAAATKSEIFIKDNNFKQLKSLMLGFSKLGINIEKKRDGILVPGEQSLNIVEDLFNAVPTIYDAPWPGFPADLTSIAIVTATQANGTVLVFEKMFESRLFFVDKLIGMGAQIVLCDPHRAVIVGRTQLNGSQLTSPDIRAGMAMLIASLCAAGKSEIHNVNQIDRGYEKLDERLKNIGANISRVKE